MTEVEQKKKRIFWKLTYCGVDLDQLWDVDLDQLWDVAYEQLMQLYSTGQWRQLN